MPTAERARQTFWVRIYEDTITEFMTHRQGWVDFSDIDNAALLTEYGGQRGFFIVALDRLVKRGILNCRSQPGYEYVKNHIYTSYSMDPLQKLAVL